MPSPPPPSSLKEKAARLVLNANQIINTGITAVSAAAADTAEHVAVAAKAAAATDSSDGGSESSLSMAASVVGSFLLLGGLLTMCIGTINSRQNTTRYQKAPRALVVRNDDAEGPMTPHHRTHMIRVFVELPEVACDFLAELAPEMVGSLVSLLRPQSL